MSDGQITMLRRAELARHSRALAAPQAFPLTDDGVHAWAAIRGDGVSDAAALAEARYRDWLVGGLVRMSDRGNVQRFPRERARTPAPVKGGPPCA